MHPYIIAIEAEYRQESLARHLRDRQLRPGRTIRWRGTPSDRRWHGRYAA